MTKYRFIRWLRICDERELYIRPELEDVTIEIPVEDGVARIRIPRFEEEWFERRVLRGRAGRSSEDLDVLIDMVEVSVDFDAAPDSDGRPPAESMRVAYRSAADAVTALKRWLRLDQPW